MSDPGKYRTREQLDEEKGRDPIPALGNLLVERGLLSKDDLLTIDNEAKATMKTVLENAEKAPWPDPEGMYKNVFAEPK